MSITRRAFIKRVCVVVVIICTGQKLDEKIKEHKKLPLISKHHTLAVRDNPDLEKIDQVTRKAVQATRKAMKEVYEKSLRGLE